MKVIERMIAHMLQEREPITVPELARVLDAKPQVVRNAMRRLFLAHEVHVAAYTSTPSGNLVACWRIGHRVATTRKPSAQALMVQDVKEKM